MAICAKCGASLNPGATFCGSCGADVGAAAGTAPPPITATGTGLASNVAGALAYVTIIPAIIFLVAEPYNRDKFIRFHSFQSVMFAVAWIVLCLVLGILGSILTAITAGFGALVMLPLWGLLS